MRVLHVSRTLPQEMLGVMYLSRAVKDAGHEMKALFLPDPKWIGKFRDYSPDIVTWSAMTGIHQGILDVNRLLKAKFDFFSFMGGPHPSLVPEIVRDPDVDAVCIGEGEGALVDLCNALQNGEEIRSIQNLCFDDGEGGLIKNPLRPLVDIEEIGFPDRSVVYDAQPLYRNSQRKVVVTQRGCPMMCSFCFHHAWKGKLYGAKNSDYVRKRSVSHVIEEVEQIRSRYSLSFVHFLDDIFNLKDDWMEEFSERWPREVGLPFDAILMANMTTEDHIRQLKSAGCVYARIAFEAANDFVRNTVFRKNTQREQLTNAAGWIKDYGIRLGSLNMLGGPGGTLEDDFDTIRLNVECQVDQPIVSIVQPYPQFELNDITKELGIAVDSYDDFPAKFNRSATIDVKDRMAVENLHKWFPLVVRQPRLMPLVRATVRCRWVRLPLLAAYMLFSQWQVAEHNALYNRCLGRRGWRTWRPVDFMGRVIEKAVVTVVATAGGKVIHRMATRLQMGDERVIAHMN